VEYGELNPDLERCRDLLEEEQYEKALSLARRLAALAPADPEVVCLLCDAALSLDEPAEAVRACRDALTAGVRDIEVFEWLVRAQWDLHLTEECRRTCRKLLAIEPDNYTALDYGLASVLELGDFEEAHDIVDRASEHHQDDPHLSYQTAVARMMRGEEEWALSIFERFLEQDPEEPGTYINLMRIHHLGERYEAVERLYHRATSHDLEHEDLFFNMALALKARGREREAGCYFIRSIRKNATLPDAHFYLGQILRTEGHPRLALWMLERELGVDDTHPAVHAEMAWAAEDLGEFAAAVRMIRAAVERAPDWGVYQHSLAELLLKADPESKEAEEAARRAVKLDGAHAAGWQVLGRMAAERGNADDAELNLRRAVASRDSTPEDEGWLGLLLVQRGRDDDARPFLERAARTYPFWSPVGDALGRIRGHTLACRYEVRLRGRDRSGKGWFRVLHVVDRSPDDARAAALGTSAPKGSGVGEPTQEEVVEVRDLGFEVDHSPGIVWDSGRSGRRYPEPPPPEPPAD
jgi:tetratricopeptide (TPR) repeat protein